MHLRSEAEQAHRRQNDRKADPDDRMDARHAAIDGGRRRRREHQKKHRGQRLDTIGAQNRDIVPDILRQWRKKAPPHPCYNPRHSGWVSSGSKACVKQRKDCFSSP
jgi:hypothetical protein